MVSGSLKKSSLPSITASVLSSCFHGIRPPIPVKLSGMRSEV